jgi:hypothetical protein
MQPLARCVLLLLLIVCPATASVAGDCCAGCGCHQACTKVCRAVCEIKKVTTPVYDCECEEFCLPGKSQRCVTFDECGHRKVEYLPTCGDVRTRNKLIKREETKEVRSYKWVVEDLCDACAARCAAHDGSGSWRAELVPSRSHSAPLEIPTPPPPAATTASAVQSRAGGDRAAWWRGALAPFVPQK